MIPMHGNHQVWALSLDDRYITYYVKYLRMIYQRYWNMKCPKCEEVDLKVQTVDDVEVDKCPSCGGIWFDHNELSKTLSLNAGELKPLTKGKESPEFNRMMGVCPMDQSDLMRVCSQQNRTIVLDRCPTCLGVWLDGGEFKRLIKN